VMQSADDVMRVNAQAAARQAQASADNVAATQSNRAGVAGETTAAVESPTGGVGTKAAPGDASASTSGMPQWLRERFAKGNDFNQRQSAKYPHNEVYVEPPCAGGNCLRLDSYAPRAGTAGEIISRKFTQLAQVNLRTAINYLREIERKYAPGTIIADVPSNRASGLAGEKLRGQMLLEVPEQQAPVPKAVLDEARKRDIRIRDEFGNDL